MPDANAPRVLESAAALAGAGSKLPSGVGGKPTPGAGSLLPSDAGSRLPSDAGSKLPSDAGSKLPSDIMGRLRAGTADLHEALEAELDWERRVATLPGYRDLLARWWGVHAAAEPGLAAAFAGDPRDRAFYEPRRKLPLLARDLRELGLAEDEIAALPTCPGLRDLGEGGAALGALYVFEGSTLGGQIMARHLARAHGLTRETGAAFLAAYPPGEVGPMWRAFRERAATESAAGGAPLDAAMLAGARRTFAAVRGWLTA